MEDTQTPLRADVRLLGDVLGAVLRDRGEPGLYDTVEEVRRLAKAARPAPAPHPRPGDPRAGEALEALLEGLPPRRAHEVARAFSLFLDLANVAEQHHRIRRRRAWLAADGPPQRGSPEESFARLLSSGVAPGELWRVLADMQIELVLTAHPTQAERRTLAAKHKAIADLLDRHDRLSMTPAERDAWHAELVRLVTSAWETPTVRRDRPTPEDEARGGLVAVEQVLWDAVPATLRSLDRASRAAGGPRLADYAAPIRFASWMGGDRDGNPNVTPETTRRVLLLGRWMAAHLLHDEVDRLRDELSVTPASEELQAAAGDDREPYRALLRPLRARLAATRDWAAAALDDPILAEHPPADVILDERELRAPLELCLESLREVGDGLLADGRLRDLLWRVAAFGLALVRLDLRQESGKHTAALDAITRAVGLGAYADWDEATRVTFLTRELAGGRPLVPPDLWEKADADVRDVLGAFAVAAREPAGSLGAYVISMARSVSDVLAVELLQREARMRFATPRSGPPMRVVPLFETLDDLEHAGKVVTDLLAVPWVRERIRTQQGGRHEVMIGYSDSAKDAGRLAAAWALYRAQKDVVAASKAAGVRVTLFHGRGGTVGRGGGPTHVAIRSQPPGSVDGTLRVTEQGEAILAKFGLCGIAVRTMEVYVTAVLEATLAPPAPPLPEWRDAMDRLAANSCTAYRDVIRQPGFMDYFRAATPLEELGRLNIGSRPARRAAGGGIETLRAIPWQFAWTQVRLMLPAWLGVGEALDPPEPAVREMLAGWAFFDSTLDLVEMTVAKALPDVHARYDALLVPPALRPIGADLRRRLERTRDAILTLRGRPLLAGNPVLARSIDVRNPYVDPLNRLQAVLLKRTRGAAHVDPELDAALLTTMNGIAAGMRNTG